jgi:hypothetical protein
MLDISIVHIATWARNHIFNQLGPALHRTRNNMGSVAETYAADQRTVAKQCCELCFTESDL